jgi:hypothetical protein
MSPLSASELRGSDAYHAIFLIDLARSGRLHAGPEYQAIEQRGRALLVMPLKGSAYVIEDVSAVSTRDYTALPIVRRTDFHPLTDSETDAVKARVLAQLYLYLCVQP